MKAAGSRRDRIRAQLADLKMPGALEAVDDVLTRVDGGGVTASEAIEQLLGAQIMLRNNRRLQAAMRSSRLPGIKTLDDFDFSFQPSIKREQIDSLHELGFLARQENVIFLGPPGVGKTHLAISLAIAAAQSGRRVYYGALADLITSLEEAKTAGQLGRRLKILTYPSLLVIDEIGYLPVSQTGAMLFFQLINRRYAIKASKIRSWATRSWPLHSSIACCITVISSTYAAAATACASTSTFPRSYTRLLRSRALYPPREREQEQRRSRRTRGSSPPPGVTFSPATFVTFSTGVDTRFPGASVITCKSDSLGDSCTVSPTFVSSSFEVHPTNAYFVPPSATDGHVISHEHGPGIRWPADGRAPRHTGVVRGVRRVCTAGTKRS